MIAGEVADTMAPPAACAIRQPTSDMNVGAAAAQRDADTNVPHPVMNTVLYPNSSPHRPLTISSAVMKNK
jgi:hypothetical protein